MVTGLFISGQYMVRCLLLFCKIFTPRFVGPEWSMSWFMFGNASSIGYMVSWVPGEPLVLPAVVHGDLSGMPCAVNV